MSSNDNRILSADNNSSNKESKIATLKCSDRNRHALNNSGNNKRKNNAKRNSSKDNSNRNVGNRSLRRNKNAKYRRSSSPDAQALNL